MRVLFIHKTTFQVLEYVGVTNIAYDSTTYNYVVTYGSGSTASASINLYNIQILW